VDSPRFVDANGIRTRCFEAGRGEPLVLIHGGTYGSYFNAEDWELNFDALAEHFRVIAFDRIGLGFSDNPRRDEEYRMGASVQHAYDVIRALDLGRAHIVGHSRGGYTAARMVLEHPEIVDTLVIVDSSTLMTPANPLYDQWDREAANYDDRREKNRYLLAANSYAEGNPTDHYLDVLAEIDALPKTAVARARMAVETLRFRADLVERQQETQAWIRAGRLTCPTLVVWAYEDPSATMDRNGIPCMDLIMPNVPDAEMVIFNRAGHLVFRERAEAFNQVVIDFIQRHRAGRGDGLAAPDGAVAHGGHSDGSPEVHRR
jgi:2-hydroxy-6-oxo-6-(2'-carboxyphenyl)-hexa-2,4-dienoate hydrolase